LMPVVARAEPSEISQLQWLDKTNAPAEFKADVSKGQLRFYVVHGYAAEILGIGWLNYQRCYAKHIGTQPIEGTSDHLKSEEHLRLNTLARRFSKDYNLMVRDHLLKIGKTDCAEGVDWDKAYRRMNDYVWGSTQQEGYVTYNPEASEKAIWDFTIVLNDLSRSDDVSKVACKIFTESSIKDTVLLRIR